MKISTKRGKRYKTFIETMVLVSMVIVAIYFIAILFTLIGVVTGNIAPDDQSLTSQITRQTLTLITII